MTFELETPTKTKVLDVRTLAKKDRQPGEDAGAQLLLSTKLSAGVLAMFDGFLPGVLFKPADKAQAEIDGIESQELTKIGEHVRRLKWEYEQTGCIATVHFATTALELDDCKVHRVSLSPQQNGGVTVQWTLDAPALSDLTRGKLSGLKATEIDLELHGPQVNEDPQRDIGGDGDGDQADDRGGDAGTGSGSTGDPVLDAAVAAHTPRSGKKARAGARAH